MLYHTNRSLKKSNPLKYAGDFHFEANQSYGLCVLQRKRDRIGYYEIEDRLRIERVKPVVNLPAALVETFAELRDKAIEPDIAGSGSTACISIVTTTEDSKVGITIANLGNSGAAIVIKKKDGTLLRIKLTEDHNPNNPRVKSEIEKKGGKIVRFRGWFRISCWCCTWRQK